MKARIGDEQVDVDINRVSLQEMVAVRRGIKQTGGDPDDEYEQIRATIWVKLRNNGHPDLPIDGFDVHFDDLDAEGSSEGAVLEMPMTVDGETQTVTLGAADEGKV